MNRFADRFKRMFIVGLKQLMDPYYQGFAAQISFYLILSIVPIFLLIIQVLGMFDINIEAALNIIEQYTGKQMSGFILNIFEFKYIGFGNIIFVLIALWAGSRASFAIARITNYIMTEGENTGKNYFLERARAVFTMFLTMITLVISIIILCYGKVILLGILSLLKLQVAGRVDSIWMWLRWPIGFILYFFMISFNYYILPTEKMRFRKVIPGTLFASTGMLIVSWIYSFYSGSLVHYDIMYGALSSVVAIMIWFLLLSWVIILGVLCNKVFEDTSEPFSKRRPAEYPVPGKWRQSKFDMDPNDVNIEIIKSVFMGAADEKAGAAGEGADKKPGE